MVLNDSGSNIFNGLFFSSKISASDKFNHFKARSTSNICNPNMSLYRMHFSTSVLKKSQHVLSNHPGCEREVVEATKEESDERKSESIMRLSWALVHARQPEDVQRGIAMLEASLTNTDSPLQKREKLYLLAVGYYRSGDYSRSRQLLDQCLEIAPDWRQALSLKKTVEDRITKDGVIGIVIIAAAVGLLAGGLAAALARKN